MSKTNKHGLHLISSPSIDFINKELGPWQPCSRKSCNGVLVSVLARYKNFGPVYEEKECTACGKVIKNQQYFIDQAEDKRKYQEQKRNRNNRNKKYRTNRR